MVTDPCAPHSFYTLPDGRRLAYRHLAGPGPTVVFLPGYMSDMGGTKAGAVFDWAVRRGHGCLLLDYSGCGQSDGDFADGTLSRWCGEVAALIDHCGLDRVVLIGSSMGGWLMLLLAEALGARIAGLVGIAAAPDFTDWGRDPAAKAALAAGQVVHDESPYGPEPTPMYPAFWADGQARCLLGRPIAFDGPVRLLQGQADADVPWAIALRLAAALRSADVQIHLIKDGDHRLSRNADMALLLATLARRGHDLAGAQGYIETAATIDPRDPAIGLEAGVIAELAGHEAAARKSWNSVIATAPDSVEAGTARGYLSQLGPDTSAPLDPALDPGASRPTSSPTP